MPDWEREVARRWPPDSPASLDPERAREIGLELSHHLQEAYEEALAAGLEDSEARARALAQVPAWDELARQVCRVARTDKPRRRRSRFMASGLVQDIRYGLRVLRQNPGFSFLATLALALGIGANAVAFTLVKGFLLESLPVLEPERLVRIYGRQARGLQYAAVSYPDVLEIREQRSCRSI